MPRNLNKIVRSWIRLQDILFLRFTSVLYVQNKWVSGRAGTTRCRSPQQWRTDRTWSTSSTLPSKGTGQHLLASLLLRTFASRNKFIVTIRGLQGDVASLSGQISPLVYKPKWGGGAGFQPIRTAVHITWHGAKINFRDLTPYLTFGYHKNLLGYYAQIYFRYFYEAKSATSVAWFLN